jgi:nucleoside-diphosphate-sugar epimerase
MNASADSASWPDPIHNETELDEVLTHPSPQLCEFIRTVSSPLLILGAGGKMGPSLAVLARRAAEAAKHPLKVIAASRFTDSASRAWLESRGVQTVSCDLIEAAEVARLPEAENIIYLVGLKFGTGKNPALTWAMNTLVPARVCERYPKARIAALSTGNVYPHADVAAGGAKETDPLTPLGEYANAAVARERVFEFCAARYGTPVALLRLYYAVDLRYGVLVDLATKIAQDEPIELGNGAFNCIWQGDANEMILRSLDLVATPPSAWNLCRPEVFSLRATALRLGELMGRAPKFEGTECSSAIVGNAARLCARLGSPAVSFDTLLRWVAHWVKTGGRNLGRPTHFEVRDGKY